MPDKTNTSNILLAVNNLSVDYGLARAVDNLSLEVVKGSIVTIIGANGAGKTTTLSALMGLIPSTGGVRFLDEPIQGLGVADLVSRRLALVPETRELFAEMSVEENLRLGAYQRYMNGERDFSEELNQVHVLFPRLKERSQQLAGTLSGGERQMLAIGRALMAKPLLLMLDEPSLGLAPLVVAEIFAIIDRLRDSGVSILLVEQNATAALRIADNAYVLESGCVAFHGTASEVSSDRRVIETYLGVSDGA
ncbi:MAG: ABC transporter ATP-binding protein [Alphaproteobacteria bacterium]|nr:ABC transporter ATP-binding protein [Alphaproteobacteria bacterium]